jgi:hypothetical protein
MAIIDGLAAFVALRVLKWWEGDRSRARETRLDERRHNSIPSG